MSTNTISIKQFICINTLFILGSPLITGTDRSAGRDTWISILFALILFLPFCLMYGRICSLYPNKDTFALLDYLFGALGKIFKIIFTGYSLFLGTMVISDYLAFLKITSFADSSNIYLVIPFVVLCIWLVLSGMKVCGQIGIIIFGFVIVFLSITLVFSMGKIQLDNLLPILDRSSSGIAASTIKTLSFPFGDSVILLLLAGNIKQEQNRYKAFVIAAIFSGIILTLVSARDIAMLGEESYKSLFFPSYLAESLINLGKYLQRMEVVISGCLICSTFLKVTLCIYAAVEATKSILKTNKKKALTICYTILTGLSACFVFPNTQDLFHFGGKIYPMIALPIQLILPAIIWISAEYKNKFGMLKRY